MPGPTQFQGSPEGTAALMRRCHEFAAFDEACVDKDLQVT